MSKNESVDAASMHPIVSTLSNCYMQQRKDSNVAMFSFGKDGRAVVNLDGYAIIPIEVYESWVGKQGGREHGACGFCKRQCLSGEPDPCLGMLPGVKAACCGHGDGGYVMFDNGTVIRGRFVVEEC